mgnify:CR=1 FL=1
MSIINMMFSNPSFTITETSIIGENFSLTESICSTSPLMYGGCENGSIKATLVRKSNYSDLVGKTFYLIYDGINKGYFKVYSCKPSTDRTTLEMVAYGTSYDYYERDISSWYNSFLANNSKTVKAIRNNLTSYLGLIDASTTLISDDVVIKGGNTVSDVIKCREMFKAIAEINGRFCQITNSGSTGVVGYKTIEDVSTKYIYPSTTLYPGAELFPFEQVVNNGNVYFSIEYEDFKTNPITDVRIQSGSADYHYGPGYGDPFNCYTIKNNVLLQNVEATSLMTIAHNFFGYAKGLIYQPVNNLVMIHDNSLNVGDVLRIQTLDDEIIDTIILEKTISGVNMLTDTITARGAFVYN